LYRYLELIMSVVIVIKVTHTESGIELEPEIHAFANKHCAHEMMFATSTVKAAMASVADINDFINNPRNKAGENKHVH
jgi:hypothetical protein